MKNTLIFSFLCMIAGVAACSDNEEAAPDVLQAYVGNFRVEERFPDDEEHVDYYAIEIKAGITQNELDIHNFGDFMYMPVKAQMEGEKFTIQPQSFQENSHKVTLSGEGKFQGDTLYFIYQYSLENTVSGHRIKIERACTGIRE